MPKIKCQHLKFPFSTTEFKNYFSEQLHGYHFIPIFDAPSAYYITEKNTSPKETLFNLIYACAELWPLLLICLLMALIRYLMHFYRIPPHSGACATI